MKISETDILLIVIALFLLIIAAQGIILLINSRKAKKEANDQPAPPVNHDRTEVSTNRNNDKNNLGQGREFEVLQDAHRKESQISSLKAAKQYEENQTINSWLENGSDAPYDPEETHMLLQDAGTMNKRVTLSCTIRNMEKIVEMRAATLSIGRDQSNSFVLPDDIYVGRKHAVLTYQNGKLELSNLSKKNGTIVQGERLDGKVEITKSTEIMVGSTKIMISVMDV